MKRIMTLALLTVLAGSLAGCNTVKGVGKDVSKGGQVIQRAAS
ncbi:entericidin A/B family lipoprotein [Legionella sp. CNM-4043-24]